MKKLLLATIELKEDYKPNKDIIIEDYNSGIFADTFGTVLIKKVKDGVSKYFKLIQVYTPMIEIPINNHIVANSNGDYFNVTEEGLVKLAFEDKI